MDCNTRLSSSTATSSSNTLPVHRVSKDFNGMNADRPVPEREWPLGDYVSVPILVDSWRSSSLWSILSIVLRCLLQQRYQMNDFVLTFVAVARQVFLGGSRVSPSDLVFVYLKMSTYRQSGTCKLYLCYTKSIEVRGLYCQLGNCSLRTTGITSRLSLPMAETASRRSSS